MNDVKKICERCPLYKPTRSFVFPEGNEDVPVAIVGMAPGEEEFEAGKPFVGPSEKLLFKMLAPFVGTYDFSSYLEQRGRFFYITNACLCDAKTPLPKVRLTCIERLHHELQQVRPQLIIALGGQALEWVTTRITSDGVLPGLHDIMSHCGFLLRVGDWLVYPMPHPASVLRRPESMFQFEALSRKLGCILRGEYEEEDVAVITVSESLTLEWLAREIEALPDDAFLAFDLETTSFDFLSDKILCVSLSFEDNTAFVIPFDPVCVPYLRRIFSSRCRKVAHNAKFDLKFLKANGIEVNNMYFDTMVAQHVLNENMPRDLKSLAAIYLNYPQYNLTLELYRRQHKVKTFDEIPEDILFTYAGWDAAATYRIAKILEPQVRHQYASLYWSVALPCQLALVEVEMKGVVVDKAAVDDLTLRVQQEIRLLEDRFFELVGERINYRSTRQLSRVLYEKIQLPVLYKTDKGAPSVDENALRELYLRARDEKHVEILRCLLQLRKRNKVLSTYLAGGRGGIWRYVKRDGRAHPIFNVTGTVTGRLSCTEPALQTIPKSAIRNIFTVPDGYRFIEADFSQAELRMLSLYANSKTLKDAFKQGSDVHRLVASLIFGKPASEVTDTERRMAKFVTFGVIYGRGAKSVADQFKIPLEEAIAILETFFDNFPEIRQYMRDVVETARRTRVLYNIFGRSRVFPPGEFLPEWERQALNFQCQSSVADWTNFCLASLTHLFKLHKLDAYVILQLHDALMFEVDESCLDETLELIRSVMEAPITDDFYLPTEIKVSDRWEGGEDLFEEEELLLKK